MLQVLPAGGANAPRSRSLLSREKECSTFTNSCSNEVYAKENVKLKSNIQSNVNRQANDLAFKNKQQNINVQSLTEHVPSGYAAVGGVRSRSWRSKATPPKWGAASD